MKGFKISRKNAAIAGVVLVIGGAWLLHQAYEGQGKPRPFALRFLPGG